MQVVCGSGMMFRSRAICWKWSHGGLEFSFRVGAWSHAVDQLRHTSSHSDTGIGLYLHQRMQRSTKGGSNGRNDYWFRIDPAIELRSSLRNVNYPRVCQAGCRGYHSVTTIKGTVLQLGRRIFHRVYSDGVWPRQGRRDNETLLSKVDCTSHRLAAGPHHGPTIVFFGIRSMNINGNRSDETSDVNLHTVLSDLFHHATSSPSAPV